VKTMRQIFGEALRDAAPSFPQLRILDVDVSCIKPLDTETICRAAEKYGCLVTLEEHNIIGGLGDAVCAAVCARKPVPVCKIGLNDCFGQSARSYQQLFSAYALDGKGVAARVEAFMKQAG